MEPRIIKSETLQIAGITGDGNQTTQLWEDFERKYQTAAFAKADENAYEIRAYTGEKCDCHVGFGVTKGQIPEGFTIYTLPPSDYAVFDVWVAKGYDSGNAAMDEWLAHNEAGYRQIAVEGTYTVVEVYTEKFGDGTQPDSVVEIWIPICK